MPQQQQLPARRAAKDEELVRLEKVSFSDDEDDNFQYTAVDDAALGIDGGDDDDEEEDFEAVLRNLSKSAAASGGGSGGVTAASSSSYDASSGERLDGSGFSAPSASLPRVHTQVRPSVVDDFIRNFLIKVGMARTLDMFNHEWYEFVAKGKLKEDDVSVVPDIYLRNQALDDQVKELRKQLDETRAITETAKGTWDKFRHQRDVHKMHHQRVLQEKDALVAKIKKLDKHVASYEPLLQELKAKYENSMKEKMLMRLERDRQVAKAEALEAQLKALGSGGSSSASKAKGDAGAPAPSSKGSSSSSASASSSGKKTKKTENETKIPAHDGANPFLEKRFEPVNVERMELAKTCQGHGNSIAAIAFHPKNPIVATVSDDETWKLWSVPNCELIMSGEGHRSWLAGIAFHPKGTHVATSSGDNTIKIWDFVSASCSLTLADHAHPVWESVFHHDGDFLVSASMDHTCKLWDLGTGKCRKTFRGHVDSVNSVCFQPYTGNICTGSGDKTVSLWDMRSGLCVQTFYGHQNACNSVAFSLAGDAIASCDADGFVKVWDVRMVAERATLDGGQHPLNSVAFDRSGKVLTSASDDGSVKVFSLKTDALVTELKGHDGPVQVCVHLRWTLQLMTNRSWSLTNALSVTFSIATAAAVGQVRAERTVPGVFELRLHVSPLVHVASPPPRRLSPPCSYHHRHHQPHQGGSSSSLYRSLMPAFFITFFVVFAMSKLHLLLALSALLAADAGASHQRRSSLASHKYEHVAGSRASASARTRSLAQLPCLVLQTAQALLLATELGVQAQLEELHLPNAAHEDA